MNSTQQRTMNDRDKVIGCAACGDSFVFSAGEQEFLAVRGVQREPRLCPPCHRSGRLAARAA